MKMMNEELLANLRRIFDLNLYEVKIWTALLPKGISTAGELSTLSGVPRSRTYDVLESLERKGFVLMRFGKPIKYVAIPPEQVVERAKKNVLKDAEKRMKQIEKLKKSELMKRLNKFYKEGITYVEPEQLSGALRGREGLYEHLEAMIRSAKESVIIVTSESGIISKVDALRAAIRDANKRGVAIRIATPITPKNKGAVEQLRGIAQVKDLREVDTRFCVVDGTQALVMLTDEKEVPPTAEIGVWVKSERFGKAMGRFFSHLWKELPELK
jgi:sugar-specific transcriptional regulator TrmB